MVVSYQFLNGDSYTYNITIVHLPVRLDGLCMIHHALCQYCFTNHSLLWIKLPPSPPPKKKEGGCTKRMSQKFINQVLATEPSHIQTSNGRLTMLHVHLNVVLYNPPVLGWRKSNRPTLATAIPIATVKKTRGGRVQSDSNADNTGGDRGKQIDFSWCRSTKAGKVILCFHQIRSLLVVSQA